MSTRKQSKKGKEMPVHPVAASLSMHSDEELQNLARSIKANGLREPITTSMYKGVKTLIDGRNRLAACKIAKVKPDFTMLNGEDLEEFILDKNNFRRNSNAGQKAMLHAIAHPEASKRGRGNKSLLSNDISGGYVRQARIVQSEAPDLVGSVMSGATWLSDAYKKVQERKKESAGPAAKLKLLKKSAPDLAELVTDEKMALTEAIAASDQREADDRERRAGFIDRLQQAIFLVGSFAKSSAIGEDWTKEIRVPAKDKKLYNEGIKKISVFMRTK